VARFKRNRKISPQALRDSVSPKVAAGLTFSDEEDKEAASKVPKSGKLEAIHRLSSTEMMKGSRVPIPQFVAEPNGVVITDDTGRAMQDVNLAHNPEVRHAIQAGNICLRCMEPHPVAFPEMCSLCGYPMRERQTLDCVMEFEGTMHVGPSKPIEEYLQEKDLAQEKAAFDRRIQEGHSRGRGARHG
jgi:hypothetical protein